MPPPASPRPAAATIPPGYLYSPTRFTNGVVVDPQPDDTFAADAPGHAVHQGKLRTRVSNGREEFLVCAHVGTNTPDNALTPFPVLRYRRASAHHRTAGRDHRRRR